MKHWRISSDDLTHPYILKFEAYEQKLLRMLNKMYHLADNDLVICDRRTGLNNFSNNLKFADKLETLGKALVTLGTKCCEYAIAIWHQISEAEDRKHVENQDIFFSW